MVEAEAFISGFPFLLGGTFIEADRLPVLSVMMPRISLPFGRDFH